MFGAILGGIASSAVGSLLGKKSKESSQETKPLLPPEYEKGYERLLADALKQYETPFTPVETTRATGVGGYGGLFDNLNMIEMQRQKDAAYNAPAPVAQPQPAQANPSDLASMRGMMEMQRLAGMGGVYGNKNTQPYEAFNNAASQADYEQMGQFLQDGGQLDSRMGAVDKQGQMSQAMIDLLNKYRRG